MTSYTQRTLVHFHVDGIPKPQLRPRAYAVKVKGRYSARVHNAETAEGWKSLVAAAGRNHRPLRPLDGPVKVALRFFMPRPKSRCRRKDPEQAIPCTSRPDLDNLAKAVLDALTQDGWWTDDSLVTTLHLSKDWHEIGGRPGCHIEITSEAVEQ